MCKIAGRPIEVPFFPLGRWRIEWTRPNGDGGIGTMSYRHKDTAQRDADACARHCREGCAYKVVPDLGGGKIFVDD